MINAMMGLSDRRIDNMGHLGGFVGGIACAFLFGPRITIAVDPYSGRQFAVNRPLLQTAVEKGIRTLRSVGLLPKKQAPPPPPPRRQQGGRVRLLQRLKSALGFGGSQSPRRPPPRGGRWGTAMVMTASPSITTSCWSLPRPQPFSPHVRRRAGGVCGRPPVARISTPLLPLW